MSAKRYKSKMTLLEQGVFIHKPIERFSGFWLLRQSKSDI